MQQHLQLKLGFGASEVVNIAAGQQQVVNQTQKSHSSSEPPRRPVAAL